MKLILILSFPLLFVACTEKNREEQPIKNTSKQPQDSLAIVNDPKNNLNIQMNSFTEIDSSGILMFPLSAEQNWDRKDYSSSYKSIPNNQNWNIVFFNTNTNNYHLLTDKKILITNYGNKYNNIDEAKVSATKQKIFYNVKTDDYNKDNVLDYKDPEYLYVSDKEGYNFTQISPTNYDLKNWQYISSSGKIIMNLVKDSDKNNLFDDKDEIVLFELDITKDSVAKEIFPVEFKNKLKVLFDKDWKVVKK
jgi:hypothetical protein